MQFEIGKDHTVLTREAVVSDIATALDRSPESIGDELNLLDEGLDSIRIMGLVERWRSAGAPDVDFPTLAADPTVAHWVSVALGEY
ncbi:phosphopantetheine-binding protein [Prescottella sp. R16]|uniref:phosphopantetheine-binding protein n=1 Tax=Prescottella sp. R16 TaxID=3064529 RepID=UPI00272E2119|nr:phosphopantetheine-binding protein [Prescottella sp. R16]